MKFLHTGDLHIGKIVNDFSMLEDQRHILEQIYQFALREQVDAVIVAGDVYDRAIPPAEAVLLFNDFLTKLEQAKIPVLMISGNHDSPERVSFAARILENQHIYISGICDRPLKRVYFQDEYGEVTFVLLPFVKPAVVGAKTNGEAVERLLGEEKLEEGRKVLITHYFVTDAGKTPELCEGETTVHVGGLDNVEASLFSDFDYVALGHIHKPQKIGQGDNYYAGAPLAYSFSEAGQEKSVNLVELKEKGRLSVTRLPLSPLHQMRRIRGRLEELMAVQVVEAADAGDYIRAELTNEEELIDPIGTLRTVYPNVMQIVMLKNEKRETSSYTSRCIERKKDVCLLFQEFYHMLRGEEPDAQRMELIQEVAREAQHEEMRS
ncbi:MAG: exonuclease SbcCD subunit D [Lachnospiraceae bacterium]|nr:exonuclease SbcCD subunit D [Lachnospiraceae bacterium]